MPGSQIIKCWDISMDGSAHGAGGVTKKLVNGYVPTYDEKDMEDDTLLQTEKSEAKKLEMVEDIELGGIKSLHHIAVASLNFDSESGKKTGIDALGVLKADVDSMGQLMACGIKKGRFTISRMAALSRQFNYYFALYIPHLLKSEKRFNDVYTVFSGGDDLFLIGPWNRTYELVLHLRKSFAEYVCRNPEIHFSAGIAMQKPGTPLSNLAATAEAGLEKAKAEGRNRFTMFLETTEWKNMVELEGVRNQLETWLKEDLITKSMLYRFNHFIDLAAMERRLLNRPEVMFEDMACLKWRAMFSYSAVRNIAKREKDEVERKQTVARLMGEMVKWLEKNRGNLRIPLWYLLYNQR